VKSKLTRKIYAFYVSMYVTLTCTVYSYLGLHRHYAVRPTYVIQSIIYLVLQNAMR